jgi:hypothetical protein
VFFILRFVLGRHTVSRAIDLVFLRVVLPRKDSDSDEKRETSKDFKEQVSLMEQLLASFHSLGSGGLFARVFGHSPHLSLEILSHKGEITLRVVTSGAERATLYLRIARRFEEVRLSPKNPISNRSSPIKNWNQILLTRCFQHLLNWGFRRVQWSR